MNTKRKQNTLLMISLFLFIFFPMIGKTQDNILDNYLYVAAKNNPGLESKFSEYQAALEKVPQVGTLPDPQVTFGSFIQPVETRVGPQQARFSVSQMFPWFGTLQARKDAASEMAKSKYEAFADALSELYYEVKSAYYDLYFTQKAIDITNENITILNSLRNLVLIKVESGLASGVDVFRVDMETADINNQLALLNDNFKVKQTAFNNLLNNPDGNEMIVLPDTLQDIDFHFIREEIVDSIQKNNPRIRQIEYMKSYYERQELVAKRAGRPGFMLGADYVVVGKSGNPAISVSESGKDAIVFPMVGISVPLYRKKYNSMVQETALMQESTENNRMEMINTLENRYEKTNRDYQDADRRIPLYTDQYRRAEKSLKILQSEYETSGKNFEDILIMERQLLNYQLEQQRALADKNTAIAGMYYLLGK